MLENQLLNAPKLVLRNAAVRSQRNARVQPELAFSVRGPNMHMGWLQPLIGVEVEPQVADSHYRGHSQSLSGAGRASIFFCPTSRFYRGGGQPDRGNFRAQRAGREGVRRRQRAAEDRLALRRPGNAGRPRTGSPIRVIGCDFSAWSGDPIVVRAFPNGDFGPPTALRSGHGLRRSSGQEASGLLCVVSLTAEDTHLPAGRSGTAWQDPSPSGPDSGRAGGARGKAYRYGFRLGLDWPVFGRASQPRIHPWYSA